jgi:hypothetical protein
MIISTKKTDTPLFQSVDSLKRIKNREQDWLGDRVFSNVGHLNLSQREQTSLHKL